MSVENNQGLHMNTLRSLTFLGVDEEGRYQFSDPKGDGRVFIGDASDYEELMSIQREDHADRVRTDKEDEEL